MENQSQKTHKIFLCRSNASGKKQKDLREEQKQETNLDMSNTACRWSI